MDIKIVLNEDERIVFNEDNGFISPTETDCSRCVYVYTKSLIEKYKDVLAIEDLSTWNIMSSNKSR